MPGIDIQAHLGAAEWTTTDAAGLQRTLQRARFDLMAVVSRRALGAGGDAWQDCAFLAKRLVNIFLEPFSGGSHRGKVEAIVQTLGAHRVLFASNFPEQNPGATLGLLLDAKLSDAEKQAVLTTNAARLFGLTRSAEPAAPAAGPPPGPQGPPPGLRG